MLVLVLGEGFAQGVEDLLCNTGPAAEDPEVSAAAYQGDEKDAQSASLLSFRLRARRLSPALDARHQK